MFWLAVWWMASASLVKGWYLPGIAPTDYEQGQEVALLVNRLTANSNGKERTLLGYDYYHTHFRFCEPEGGKEAKSGSLGAILFGDRIYTSPIKLHMLQDEQCHQICTTTYRKQDSEFVSRRIVLDFYQHWLVDGLPVSGFNGSAWYSNIGFPLGEVAEENAEVDEVRLFNHYEITVEYHETDLGYRIVGAYVTPHSRANTKGSGKCDATNDVLIVSDSVNDLEVTFSYSVRWLPSDTPWATRWDRYLQITESRVNWFALINTTIVVFLLVMLASLSLTRMLRKDIARYNELDLDAEEVSDENGWKMVNGDVFRPPQNRMLYSLMVGSGAQTLVTVAATLFLALLGFLSPANRGSFATALLLLNTVFGGLGGYVSASVYKAWGGDRWKLNLILTPTVVPVIVFGMFFSINMLLVMSEASGAVPIGSMIVLLLIWSLISVPLSWVCGFLAFRKPSLPAPTRVNQIPRQIPPAPWYAGLPAGLVLGGFVPFLAVAMQLHYIMSAIWFGRLYYMFGFLFASFLAMILLSGACSALALYVGLNSENYHWQWRVVFVAGSPAIYVFIYSCYYLTRYMSLEYLSGRLLYLGYSFMASVLCFLALGSIGALVSLPLVRNIYTSIKVD